MQLWMQVLTGYLELAAEYCGVGSCIIGDMKFEEIKEEFNLRDSQVYFLDIELGIAMK